MTAGIVAAVRINAGFKPEAVGIIGDYLDAVRKAFFMELYLSFFTASAEKAVIRVEICITAVCKSGFNKRIRLIFYNIFIYMCAEAIP